MGFERVYPRDFLPRVEEHFNRKAVSLNYLLQSSFTEQEFFQIMHASMHVKELYTVTKKKTVPQKTYKDYLKERKNLSQNY